MRTQEKFNQSQENQPSFFNGLMLGVIAGFAGCFLFGTKKGGRVRQKLLKYVEQEWEEAEEFVGKAEEAGNTLKKDVGKVRRKLEHQAGKAQVAAHKELKQLQATVEQAREKADAVQETLRETAAKIERRFFVKNGRSLGK